tara:strand:- start:389 stop:496 length:108 start_codon:yes stop_codon:yes gene_type:complete
MCEDIIERGELREVWDVRVWQGKEVLFVSVVSGGK